MKTWRVGAGFFRLSGSVPASGVTRFLSILIAGLLAQASLAPADELNVYAAASLNEALKEIAVGWEEASGHRVVFNLGGSNDLARQIRSGAPADVFLSADSAQMDGLEREGLVRGSDRVDLLSNVLVVIAPADSGARMTGPADLASFRTIALADPQAVPAGVYARSWLEGLGLWPTVKDRIVPALNVRAALAAVESGNVEAGIVYKTDAALSKRARALFEVPRAQGPPIVYPLAPVATSNKPAAAAFVRHLQSAAAREVFVRYGFVVLAGQ